MLLGIVDVIIGLSLGYEYREENGCKVSLVDLKKKLLIIIDYFILYDLKNYDWKIG